MLVADDHPIYREGIVRAIKDRPDLELVGEAGDGREALEQIRRLKPEVAVLDIRMPGLDGTQVLAAMRREGLATEVLFLSAFMEPELAYKTVAAGAKGYLSKESSRQEVCEAIVTIARGGTALAAEAQAGLAEQIQERERSGGPPQLTEREQEVLHLVAEGYSAPDIGKQHPPLDHDREEPPALALREARRLRPRRRRRRGDAPRAARVRRRRAEPAADGAAESERPAGRDRAAPIALREQLDTCRQLVAQVMDAEDQGRRRIAQLIHDDSLQTLLAANQELIEAAPGRAQVQRAHEVVEATIARLREAMLALHPVTLEQGGFEQALGAVARQAARQGGFEVALDVDAGRARPARTSCCSPIARELLTNAARHAQARPCDGRSAPRGDALELEVTDDGERDRRPERRGRGARRGPHRPRLGQRAGAGGGGRVRARQLERGHAGAGDAAGQRRGASGGLRGRRVDRRVRRRRSADRPAATWDRRGGS